MGILNKLKNIGTVLNPTAGTTPPTPVGATHHSKLQYEYSINGNPYIANKPQPSRLSIEGQTPTNNYRDNTPEGQSF
tara:strand:+ start:865 stop:1095 length:231 start_codon:yes stop_codon:yes gene_type:complete